MITIPLTRQQFDAKAEQLKQEHGITLSGDSGTVSKLGTTLDYDYDGIQLTVTVRDKPFLFSEKHVEATVAGWLSSKPAPAPANPAPTQQEIEEHKSSGSVVAAMIAILFFAVSFLFAPQHVKAQTTTNLYAGGISYNRTATPTVAGTALYAHAISPDTTNGMQAFTVLDVLPAGATLNVTTNIGAGIAEKVATIGNFPIYVPTSAGISLNSTNTGWAWTGGVMTSYRPRADKNFYILPSVRFLKSSIGGGGYQLIPGVLFGWGK